MKLKSTKKVRIFYWVTLIVLAIMIYRINNIEELLKLVALGIAILLVETISQREIRQVAKEK